MIFRFIFCFSSCRTKNIWLRSFCVVHQRFPRERRRYVYTNIPCKITPLLTKHEQIMAECWDRLKSLSPPKCCIYSQHKLRTLTFFSTSNTLRPNCCVDYVKIWATAAQESNGIDARILCQRLPLQLCLWHIKDKQD